MNKIHARLSRIRQENRLGIMAHIVLGYPSLEESKELVRVMAEAGVDFVEMQIPFSDPMADGPTIMKANAAALHNGMTVAKSFEAMQELSQSVGAGVASAQIGQPQGLPLLFMTYYNIVFNYGVERFCKDAVEAGASGLIIPDVPVDEESHEHFFGQAQKHDLIAMKFLSMVSTEKRVKEVLSSSNDFLYFFGQKGTTGARSSLHEELRKHLERVKNIKDAPTAVGFGISKPEHIQELKKTKADVAVIGSAVLNTYNNAKEGEEIEEVKKYLEIMIEVIR